MAEVLVSLFGALGTIVASYYAYQANRQGKLSSSAIDEINDAVNHRHEKGTPRLYDMVWSNFNRVSKLERSVREIKQDIKDITHVVSQHELEIDSIEDKIGDE
jgi:predicted  nucleic acid-binding Zn-ribbon protein